jgi:hypothetical protein
LGKSNTLPLFYRQSFLGESPKKLNDFTKNKKHEKAYSFFRLDCNGSQPE